MRSSSLILTLPLLSLLATGEGVAHAFFDHAEPRVLEDAIFERGLQVLKSVGSSHRRIDGAQKGIGLPNGGGDLVTARKAAAEANRAQADAHAAKVLPFHGVGARSRKASIGDD
jgi:hypothetical protein